MTIENIDSKARKDVLDYITTVGTASYQDIADQFDIGKSTARDHISSLRNEDGVPIGERRECGVKVFYYRPDAKEYPVNPSQPDGDLRSKAAVTSEAKEKVHELIQYLNADLTGRAPAVPEGGLTVREGNEDMVCHRSDDHIGAAYSDEYGNDTFNADIGISRVRTVNNRVFETKKRQEDAGIEFDTLHLVMGGDHLHGTGIHDDQPWETELSIPEQLTVATDIYMEFIDRATKEFESVQVVCQPGNHGELRGDGMAPDDNVDTAFFMMLDRRVRDREYDNVKFVRSESGNFTNFRMRVDKEKDQEKANQLGIDVSELPTELESGHRGHLRHGQDSLEHIGTSSGKNRWRGWLNKHKFDIAYRGHYHTLQLDSVLNTKVVESGAIVPPDDFEESLSEWSEPAATVHGISDTKTMTWFYPIDFESPPV